MKRLCAAALICMTLCGGPSAAVAADVQVPSVSASSAILMDAGSARVLYEKDAHQPRLIASITKLMTALVALEEKQDLDELVTVQPEWTGAEGSSIYLKAGETVTLETLLYGMLLRSGNDAALAVAGHCAGSVEGFVGRMNEKARELGMEDSHFANPNGLNAEEHYSSAYDMALLARACLENDILREIVSTKSITLGDRIFTNHNKLLWRYEGCIGLKTGYTEKAGRTLVSAAERNGLTLICVTLNAPNDWADHAALLDYGFARYEGQTVACAGEVIGYLPVNGGLVPTCPVAFGSECTLALLPEETAEVSVTLEESQLTAPVKQGDVLGEVVWSVGGQELGRASLVAGANVMDNKAEEGNLLGKIRKKLLSL